MMNDVNSNKDTYTVSVVIPTYNMGWCITRAIKSCQNQSYRLKEIIIADSSTDNTKQIILEMARKDERIRYIPVPLDRGNTGAILEGIRVSTGTWVAFLDADDELTKKSIEYRVETLEKNISLKPGLVYGHVYMEKESEESLFRNPVLNGDVYPFLCKELSLCQQISMMVRRECFASAGFINSNLPGANDDDMIMTIGKHFPVVCADKPVAIIHLHKSESRMTNDLFRATKGVSMLVNKYKDEIIKYHGNFYFALWQLRIVADYMRAESTMGVPYHLIEASKNIKNPIYRNLLYVSGYILRKVFWWGYKVLRKFLKRYFEFYYL